MKRQPEGKHGGAWIGNERGFCGVSVVILSGILPLAGTARPSVTISHDRVVVSWRAALDLGERLLPTPVDSVVARESSAGPWGIWATLGFSLLIVAAYVLVQVLVSSLLAAAELQRNPSLDVEAYSRGLAGNGLLLALATVGGMLTTVALVGLFVRLRKDVSVSRYLHLRPVKATTLAGWLGFVFALALLWDAVTYLLGRSVIPDFMLAAYQSAGFTPLFWLALVAAAPLAEEVFFRGFLFEGISHARLGANGAIVLTSLAWALVHVQYDAYEIGTVFVLGLVLGVARVRTNSLYTTVAMHALVNLLATSEVAVYLQRASDGT